MPCARSRLPGGGRQSPGWPFAVGELATACAVRTPLRRWSRVARAPAFLRSDAAQALVARLRRLSVSRPLPPRSFCRGPSSGVEIPAFGQHRARKGKASPTREVDRSASMSDSAGARCPTGFAVWVDLCPSLFKIDLPAVASTASSHWRREQRWGVTPNQMARHPPQQRRNSATQPG